MISSSLNFLPLSQIQVFFCCVVVSLTERFRKILSWKEFYEGKTESISEADSPRALDLRKDRKRRYAQIGVRGAKAWFRLRHE